jgi:integrase
MTPIGDVIHPSRPRRARGDGRIFTRRGTYYIAYYFPTADGRSKEKRERAGTLQQAEKLLRKRLAEVAMHKGGLRRFQGPDQERVMFEALLKDLEREYQIHGRKSLPQLRSRLKHVRGYFAVDRALAITPDRLRLYIAHRQEQNAAEASVNRELEAIGRAFALARESGRLSFAPKVPSLREDNARQGFFERAEFERVLHNLDDQDVQDFCTWMYLTGMRPGEIRALAWDGFDRETWTLRLHAKDAKTGHGRALVLEGPFRAVIERRLKARRLDCKFIFHRAGRPMGEFRKRWKTACKAAGIKGRLVYDLRRTAVRNMIRAGVDPSVAMKISGHRTRSMLDRYNVIDDRDLRDAVVKTAGYLESLPSKLTIIPLRPVPPTKPSQEATQ